MAATIDRLPLPSIAPVIQITAMRTRLRSHTMTRKQPPHQPMHRANTSSPVVMAPVTSGPHLEVIVCKDRITIPSKRGQPRRITMRLGRRDINHKTATHRSVEEAKEEVTVVMLEDNTIIINSILTTTIITTTEFFSQLSTTTSEQPLHHSLLINN